jgi:hypothetical protein
MRHAARKQTACERTAKALSPPKATKRTATIVAASPPIRASAIQAMLDQATLIAVNRIETGRSIRIISCKSEAVGSSPTRCTNAAVAQWLERVRPDQRIIRLDHPEGRLGVAIDLR